MRQVRALCCCSFVVQSADGAGGSALHAHSSSVVTRFQAWQPSSWLLLQIDLQITATCNVLQTPRSTAGFARMVLQASCG
jgi:hypothetical protein